MSKVMIVEDDDSLREIYAIRLTAEGYAVVSARDGEEALAVAVRERPDLIVSDVMMPKISGFDMLDILRSTPETKNIKVIMMTALSSEDQRERGENLGADRYIVKSQVGIEDVVNVVHEVLGDRDASGTINTDAPVEQPAVASPTLVVTPGVQPGVMPQEQQPEVVAQAQTRVVTQPVQQVSAAPQLEVAQVQTPAGMAAQPMPPMGQQPMPEAGQPVSAPQAMPQTLSTPPAGQ